MDTGGSLGRPVVDQLSGDDAQRLSTAVSKLGVAAQELVTVLRIYAPCVDLLPQTFEKQSLGLGGGRLTFV